MISVFSVHIAKLLLAVVVVIIIDSFMVIALPACRCSVGL